MTKLSTLKSKKKIVQIVLQFHRNKTVFVLVLKKQALGPYLHAWGDKFLLSFFFSFSSQRIVNPINLALLNFHCWMLYIFVTDWHNFTLECFAYYIAAGTVSWSTTKCLFFPSLSGKHLEILFWDNSDLKFKKGNAEVSLRYQIAHCFLKKNSDFKYLPARNKIIMQFLLIIVRLLHRFCDWMQMWDQ